jgi:hypothetical protein
MNPALVVLAVAVAAAPVEAREGERNAPEIAAAGSADVWLVSTRRLPSGACSDGAQPDFSQLAAGAEWAPADERAFLAADRASIATVFFIHGNRWDADRAAEEGTDFCEELRALAPGAHFRFVVWSWPADRASRRNRPDLQIKDVRSRHEAVYLARLLDQIHPDVPVSLVGYSYGAQTIGGALRLLAGGCYAGSALERRGPPRRAPLRAVLVAGAMESDALANGDAAHSPLGQVDRILVTCNGRDSTLRFYPLLFRRRGLEALGYAGPSCLDPGDPNSPKVEMLDLAQAVGKRHDWQCYRNAWPLKARLAWYTLMDQAEGSAPSDANGE